MTDTTSLTSAYDIYEVEFINVLPVTNETTLTIQVQLGAGTAFKTTSGYLGLGCVQVNGGSFPGSSTVAFIPLTLANNASNSISNSGAGICGKVRIYMPAAGSFVMFKGEFIALSGGSGMAVYLGGGYYNTAGVVTGIKILMASGNIAAQGKIIIRGVNT